MSRRPKGRYVRSDGYVILSGGRHGQYEHRAVLEKKLGRKLRPGELAHHENEIRHDNRPRNLKPKTYVEHNRHHFGKLIAAKCGACRKPITVHPYKFRYSKSGKVFCNNHCSGKFNNGKGIKGVPFTKRDDNQIVKLRAAGWAWNRIAKKLGRNRESIRTRGLRLDSLYKTQ